MSFHKFRFSQTSTEFRHNVVMFPGSRRICLRNFQNVHSVQTQRRVRFTPVDPRLLDRHVLRRRSFIRQGLVRRGVPMRVVQHYLSVNGHLQRRRANVHRVTFR